MKRVYEDGAYDTSEGRMTLVRLGIEPIIPPEKKAILRKTSDSPWMEHRNKAISEIAGLGGDEAGQSLWKKLKKYHRRSLVETAMFRLKTLFGGSLKVRKTSNQQAETFAACLALNKMNRLGMPNGEWLPI